MQFFSILRKTVALPLLVLAWQPAMSTPVETPWTRITEIDGGWTDPYMGIATAAAFVNPAACPWAGLYNIDPQTAGYQLFDSMVISAFMAGKEVSFTIDGCTANRPKVIAVKVR